MASQRFNKGSPEWEMFQDYWQLCQKFWIVEDNDTYWDVLIEDVCDFYKKHELIDLAKEMTFALLNYLENKWNIQNNNKNA